MDNEKMSEKKPGVLAQVCSEKNLQMRSSESCIIHRIFYAQETFRPKKRQQSNFMVSLVIKPRVF